MAATSVTAVTTSGSGITSGNGSVGLGAVVNFTVTFSGTETVNTSGGTPTLALNDGGIATYVSGSGSSSLVFQYVVGAGQNTTDLTVTSLSLNGGTIRNGTTNATTSGAARNPAGTLVVDTPPVVKTFTASSSAADVNTNVTYTIVFSEAVTAPSTGDFAITGTDAGASITGVTGTGTTYAVTVNTGSAAQNGQTLGLDFIGTSVKDQDGTVDSYAGGTSHGPTVTVDTVTPTVLSVATSGSGITAGSGNLNAGKAVTLTVNFSENVLVTTTGGTPRLLLDDGGAATYAGGTGTSALTFTYTVAAGQNTNDLNVTSVNLNGGTIKDAAGHAADLAGAVQNPVGTLVVDTAAPTLASFTPDNAITNASSVTFTAVFSEAVTGVTAAAFSLDGADTDQGASITSVTGSGTTYAVTVATGGTGHSGTIQVDFGGTVTDSAGNVAKFGGFQARSTYGAGAYPAYLAFGDVNEDGKPDLVTTNEGTDTLSVMLGNGNGSFQPATSVATGSTPGGIAVADFNHDGHLDLVAAPYGDNTVQVFLGNGNGTFQDASTRTYVVASGPTSILAVDIDKNGTLDLVVTSNLGGATSVLLGNGDGSFQPAISVPAPTFVSQAAVVDVNGDGKLDLVTGYSAGLQLALGNGDGTFQGATDVASAQVTGVVAADLNGDGKADLVFTDKQTNRVFAMLGNGDGSFRSATPYATGTDPEDVAVGDVNGDGKLDLVVVNQGSNTLSVFLGNGDGTFQAATSTAAGSTPYGLALGDLNDDGKADIAAGNVSGTTLPVSIFLTIPSAKSGIATFSDAPTNNPPSGADKTITINEDTPYTFATDDFGFSDVDGNSLTSVVITTLPTAGQLVLSGGAVSAGQEIAAASIANLSFIPALDGNGTAAAAFTFQIRDGGGVVYGGTDLDPSPNQITFDVTAVNDAPTATAPATDYAATEQVALSLKNTGLSVGDVDGGSGSETLTLSVGEGTLSGVAGTSGATIGGSGTASLTVSGTIAQINAFLNTDGTSTLTFKDGSDTPSASTTLSLSIDDGGNTGGGTLTGTASSTIDITAVNDAPVNTVPGAQTTDEDTNFAITGLAIADADAGTGRLTTTLSVGHGVLTVSSAGGAAVTGSGTGTVTLQGTVSQINATLAAADNVIYHGAQDFNGSDALTITTNDNGHTGGNGLPTTDTVALTVSAANDSVTGAAPTTLMVAEDAAVAIAGLGIADVDATIAPSGIYQVSLDATHGTLTLGTTTGLTFTGGANGTHAATITGTLAAINTALASASYTGDPNFNGSDAITFAVTDQASGGTVATGAGTATSDSHTIAVTISAIQDANNNTLTTDEDTSGTLDVPANDTFGAGATISAVTNGQHGTVTNNNDGTVTYTPAADYNGTDTFTYTASMSGGTAETAIVTVTVSAVNDTPVAADGAASGNEDTAIAGTVPAASDIDNTAAQLSYLLVGANGGAAHGTVTFHADGTFSYTPDADFNGTDSFSFKANDGLLDSNIATESLAVNAVNDAPVIVSNGGGAAATLSVQENTVAVTVAHATDPDGDALTYSIVGGADAALFHIDAASGALVFNTAPDFEAPTDSDASNSYVVQVRASDGSLFDDQAITVNVADVSEAPGNPGVPTGAGGPAAATVTVLRPTDFNVDGTDDLLFRNGDGSVSVFVSSNGHVNPPAGPAGFAPLTTDIVGTGDFNGDGRGDILFRSAEGHVTEWLMNGGQIQAISDIGSTSPDYQVAGTGDFNGDRTDDILFRGDNGDVVTWSMQSGHLASIQTAGTTDATSHIQGTGDFNGDGRTDVLFRNDSGQVTTWLMNANGQAGAIVPVGSAPSSAHIAATGDFDGNGTTDILFRADNGHVTAWLMNGGHIASIVENVGSADASWHIQGAGDVNRNGTDDIIWRNDDGHVVDWMMNAGHLTTIQDLGHTPVPTHIGGSQFDLL